MKDVGCRVHGVECRAYDGEQRKPLGLAVNKEYASIFIYVYISYIPVVNGILPKHTNP